MGRKLANVRRVAPTIRRVLRRVRTFRRIEGLHDREKDRDQERQEEHDERAQVRREEREDRTQAREDDRETRRQSP